MSIGIPLAAAALALWSLKPVAHPEALFDATILEGEFVEWVEQSLLLTNVDLNWRYRDADTDMRFVFRDAYSADLKNSAKSKNRLSALYYEHRSLSAGTRSPARWRPGRR